MVFTYCRRENKIVKVLRKHKLCWLWFFLFFIQACGRHIRFSNFFKFESLNSAIYLDTCSLRKDSVYAERCFLIETEEGEQAFSKVSLINVQCTVYTQYQQILTSHKREK
jgi:hypothetical protein